MFLNFVVNVVWISVVFYGISVVLLVRWYGVCMVGKDGVVELVVMLLMWLVNMDD